MIDRELLSGPAATGPPLGGSGIGREGVRPACRVEIPGELEEARDERQSHGEAVAVAMLADVAQILADALGILQHDLEFVGREIPGHEPALAQHLIGHHGQVRWLPCRDGGRMP